MIIVLTPLLVYYASCVFASKLHCKVYMTIYKGESSLFVGFNTLMFPISFIEALSDGRVVRYANCKRPSLCYFLASVMKRLTNDKVECNLP